MKRERFLKSIFGTGALLSIPFSSNSINIDELNSQIKSISEKCKGNMIGFKTEPIKTVKVGLIGIGNRGKTLIQMFDYFLNNKKAEIVALCDLDKTNIDYALNYLKSKQSIIPKTYANGEHDWQNVAKLEDVDLLLIATPWEWHTKMAIFGMENGKHVASEVPIAYTFEDCMKLVETAERTKRHCIMIENCCYNSEELWIMNMIQEGVFGKLTHAECAYNHDLRALLLHETYYKDQWRMKHHTERNGNLYTTHGIGPVSFYMNIGRGDAFKYLTSMSSKEENLSAAVKEANQNFPVIKCGDVNTSLIKTENGKSIMLQFDVHTGRPYSRINQLVGTKAVHEGYPSRLYIDGDELEFWGHKWLTNEDYLTFSKKYEHPMITKLKKISSSFKQGHGGMDFIMIYRLISCLNQGIPLDINVYDSVMWSVISPLSELSVSLDSKPIAFPDFTAGKWKEKRESEIMREI
ncbi:MAG: Gfo/Idh/MocA family oxidoreductase [Flavobacteriales bacterium]|jgi:predicted dehydrogenase|nr:Gfo/Idh/MocA family oxidoreductase [Flavobacteriales bacterium]